MDDLPSFPARFAQHRRTWHRACMPFLQKQLTAAKQTGLKEEANAQVLEPQDAG